MGKELWHFSDGVLGCLLLVIVFAHCFLRSITFACFKALRSDFLKLIIVSTASFPFVIQY